ncbi:MAG: LysM peptidoglycan-binding domain-containing protein [Actinobacteria bacterium]|nr:LysM peptidoglycan-binding domain-containing protein [Actinomycetota bacterium]
MAARLHSLHVNELVLNSTHRGPPTVVRCNIFHILAISELVLKAVDYDYFVVQPGDTLWGIASALAPEGDPRALVDQLIDLAGGSQIQPGQQLVVPLHWLD